MVAITRPLNEEYGKDDVPKARQIDRRIARQTCRFYADFLVEWRRTWDLTNTDMSSANCSQYARKTAWAISGQVGAQTNKFSLSLCLSHSLSLGLSLSSLYLSLCLLSPSLCSLTPLSLFSLSVCLWVSLSLCSLPLSHSLSLSLSPSLSLPRSFSYVSNVKYL